MGYAQGTLLKKELFTFMNEVWDYLEDQVVSLLGPYAPKLIQDQRVLDQANY